MTEKFDELKALEDPAAIHAWLHQLESQPDALTPYERGWLNGLSTARGILDLTYSTEMMQVSGGWMPDIRPASAEQRRGWLRGYAWGILSVTDDPEA